MSTPPSASSILTAQVRDILAGGKRALTPQRDAAVRIAEKYPRIGDTVGTAFGFHRQLAAQAVSGTGGFPRAAWVIFAGAGFAAPDGPLHASAAAAAPGARFLYADASGRVAGYNTGRLAAPGRVAVAAADPADAAAVLTGADAAELVKAGPGSVHLVLALHCWPADLAAGVLAGYARLLRQQAAGSSLVLSLGIPDPGPAGCQLAEDLRAAGAAVWMHSPRDVAAWITGAGLRLHPEGVRPARAWGRPAWTDRYRVAPRVPGRVYGAAGTVV